MAKMDEEEVKSILRTEMESAIGLEGSQLSVDRQKLNDFYMGRPYGDERDGESSVVSRNVMEAIEQSIGPLLKVFWGTDVWKFEPQQPSDEKYAEQATDYTNWILTRQNPGFSIFHTWFRDALLSRVGYLGVQFCSYDTTSVSEFTGLSDDEYQAIANDDSVEITEHEEYDPPDDLPPPPQAAPKGMPPGAPVGPPGPMMPPPPGLPPPRNDSVTSPMGPPVPPPPMAPPSVQGPPMPPPMAGPPPGPMPPASPMPMPAGPPGMPVPMGAPAPFGPPVAPPPELLLSLLMASGALEDLPKPKLHDITVRITKREEKIELMNIPPEEIIFSRNQSQVYLDGKHFLCRRTAKTVTELREAGYDNDLIEEAAKATSPTEFELEALSRRMSDEYSLRNERTDEAMKMITVCDAWIRIDEDDDGIAELRHITYAGDYNPTVILDDNYCDDIPIIALCPVPLSHVHVGLGIGDMVADLQRCKTAILRGVLNSLYLSNTPKMAVQESSLVESSIDDLLSPVSGSIIRVGDINGIQPLTVPFLGRDAMGIVQYLDEAQSIRSGVNRQQMGLDPESFANRTTATEANLQMSASNQRLELIARLFAEQGLKPLALKILGLIVKHQQKEKIIRLRDEYISIDPRQWKNAFDVSVSVGLGSGNKALAITQLTSILQIQNQIIQQQGGFGPLVGPENVYECLDSLTSAMGFAESGFFSDPSGAPPGAFDPNQKPDPAMKKIEAEIAALQMKTQAEIALNQKKFEHQAQLELARSKNDALLEKLKLESQLAVEQERARSKTQMELMRQRGQADNEAAGEALDRETRATTALNDMINSRIETEANTIG